MEKKMKRILFLTNGKNDMVKTQEYGDGIYAYPVYRYDLKIYKAFAKIIKKFCQNNILEYVLGKWARNVNNFDIIICEGLKGKNGFLNIY